MSSKVISRFCIFMGLLTALVFLSGTNFISAQTLYYPSLGIPAKSSMVQVNGSPSLAVDSSGTVWVAYPDRTTGFLTVGSSTDGVNYTTYTSDITMTSDPTITFFTPPGQSQALLYIAFVYANAIDVYQFSSGTFTQTAYLSLNGSPYAGRPALKAFGAYLYVAWQGRAYDPGTGGWDGQWINVETSLDGVTFTDQSGGYYGTPISEAYSAGSGPAMELLPEFGLVLTYLDAATGYPQMFTTATPGSATFTNTTGPGGAGGHYAGDPAMVYFQNGLFAMFRSAYSADNLWVIGTNTPYEFEPPFKYAQTLTYSPALAVYGNNALYQSGRTNYPGSGPYMWTSIATENATNPY